MKPICLLTICMFLFSISLFSQKKETVLIKSGTRVIDYFQPAERYLYPEFNAGKCTLTDGRTIPGKFNYNLLTGEMDFLKGKDTLALANKDKIQVIAVEKDTFYYQNYCLQMVKSGRFKVLQYRRLDLTDIQKKGAMGTINRSAASDSYDYYTSGANYYSSKSDADLVFQKIREFYFMIPGNTPLPFNKKNIFKALPHQENMIKDYLKSNNIDFKSGNDLMKMADYLEKLLSEKL